MTLSFNQLLRLSILAVLLTALFSATTAFAQEPEEPQPDPETPPSCGEIVYPDPYGDYIQPIEDCSNPFDGLVQTESDLIFAGAVIEPGDDLSIGLVDWGLFDEVVYQDYRVRLFRQTAANRYEFLRNFNPGNQYTSLSSGLYSQEEITQLENRF